MSKILKRTMGASALLLMASMPLHADTMYLFSGDRASDPNKANSIHRFSFDSNNPGVITPAPSVGQTGAIWGQSVGKAYKGMRLTDVTVAPNGDVYAVCRDTKSVIRFDGQTGADKGEVITGLNNPDGLTIGPDGNLYITNNETIVRYTPAGKPLPGEGQIGNIFALGGRLSAASGIAFGPDGNLYVASQATHQVLRYSGATGQFMGVFVAGNLNLPSELAFGPDGNLYVASTGGPSFNPASGYVAKFDGVTGKFINQFAPDAKGATGLTFAENGDLFVTGYWSGQLARYDAKSGQRLNVISDSPAGTAFYYLSLARQATNPKIQLKPAVIKFPTRVVTPMKTNPNELAASNVKGWKNALLPKGKPGPLLTLASKKKTEYVIALSAKASTMDQKAAAILAASLKQMTGATYAIVREGAGFKTSGKAISIGRTELLKKSGLKEASLNLGTEGYAIGAKGSNLFLIGGTMRGAIYAVYSLLEEDLGCRWYTSDGKGRIPRAETLSFKPALRHFVPTLEIRDPYYYDAFDTDWSLKNKTNSPAAPVPNDWGGYASYGGYFVHTYNALVPPSEYFATHPEYYAEIGGKRQPTQLDLSNPDVLRITVENVKKALRADPNIKFFSVSANDGRGYCECAICSAMDKAEATAPNSKSGSLFKFVNEVAEAIEPEFPHVKISTLAYLDTYMPPKTIRPRKNVAVQLCTDVHAWRYQFCRITESKEFQTAMKAWDDIGADIHIWDYTASFVHYLVPMPNLPVVTDNVKFYLDHGAKGIMLQGVYNTMGSDMAPMRSWIWAKQLWDPTLDTRALMRDFIYGYYGDAAEPMWNYNMMLWQMWEDNHKIPHVHDGTKPSPNPLLINDSPCSAPPDWSLLSQDYLDKSTKIFEQAEALAKDPETLQKVKTAKISLLYVKLGQGLGYITEFGDYTAGSWVKSGDPKQKVYYENLFKEFLNIAETANVTRISEHSDINRLTAKWKEMLARGWVDVPSVRLNNEWKFKIDPEKVGVAQNWFAPEVDDAAWANVYSDRKNGWESQGFADHKGTAWYRQKVTLPPGLEKRKHLYLYFSSVDAESEIYINGTKVFEHTLASTGLAPEAIWNAPFAFDAAPFLKRDGENTIAVRVSSNGGVRGIWRPAFLFSSDTEVSVANLTNATLLAG